MLRQEPFPDSDWLTAEDAGNWCCLSALPAVTAQPPSAGPPPTQAKEHSLVQWSWFYWHQWDQTSPRVLQPAILNSDYGHYSFVL